MDTTTKSCRDFVAVLASAAPTPGGGGAAALAGAIGTALGNMVGALTVGKKKYAPVEDEVRALMAKCDRLQAALLDQVEQDELGFLPLQKAYSIPKSAPEREAVLEDATVQACQAPFAIMELCCQAISCIRDLSRLGSRLACSDAACAAVICKAALQAASVNVFANTSQMKNRAVAEEMNARAHDLLECYGPVADSVFTSVTASYE